MDPSASLTLVDAFVPRLTAGKYELTASQTLRVAIKKDDVEPLKTTETLETPEPPEILETLETTKTFYVQGPRFSLAPDEIYARFPADGHAGAYHETVPHVVFRRKALPWERVLAGGTDGDATPPDPWMALLLFDAGELPEGSFTIQSSHEVIAPPDPVRGPRIDLDPWEVAGDGSREDGKDEARRCTVLDLPLDLFRSVAPRRAELGWLAHARLVGTHDKEDVFGVGDGWFSVVLSNRLPAEGRRNLAVLVSLEGHEALIDDEAPDLPATTIVRLVVLEKWAFLSKGATFAERVTALYEEKDIWLRASNGEGIKNPQVATALSLGYAPLQHQLRDGRGTLSWFRGPLVPVAIPAASMPPIFANADEALQYDVETGLFDASYAGAWQLGRLLALQSQEFARALFSDGGSVAAALADGAERSFPDFDAKESEEMQANRRNARLERAERLRRDDLMIALAVEWSG